MADPLQHHPTTQLARLPTAGTAGDQSTCHACISYATMSMDSHFTGGGVIGGWSNRSATWYDSFNTKMHMPAIDFAYDYLTRSGTPDEVLNKITPGFMENYRASKNAPRRL